MNLTADRDTVVTETNYLIETIIDKCVVEKKKPKFDFYKHFMSSGLDKKTIAKIKENNKLIISEKEDAQLAYEKSDPFLVEAYSNFSRPHLRQYIELLEEIIHDVEKYHQDKSTIRRTRKNKKVDPNKLVKGVRYNKEIITVGSTQYTSLEPRVIIGAKQVCLYNTKTREFTLYVGDYLKVKGSTIIDFNIEKSWTKTLRKPEEILETAMNCTRNSTKNLNNLIRSKERKPNGRINVNHIIVKVFTI